MAEQSRNMPEQERSIKSRSNELFVDPLQEAEAAAARATKPFSVYLRETPARPFSPLTKAIFWLLGTVVALLFLGAVWQLSQGKKKPKVQGQRGIEKTARLLEGRQSPGPRQSWRRPGYSDG